MEINSTTLSLNHSNPFKEKLFRQAFGLHSSDAAEENVIRMSQKDSRDQRTMENGLQTICLLARLKDRYPDDDEVRISNGAIGCSLSFIKDGENAARAEALAKIARSFGFQAEVYAADHFPNFPLHPVVVFFLKDAKIFKKTFERRNVANEIGLKFSLALQELRFTPPLRQGSLEPSGQNSQPNI